MTDTWDGEEDNKPSLILDWATAERVAATDRVFVTQLIADIGTEFSAEDAARESAKERLFNRGRLLFKTNHQLNVRG